MILRMYLEDTKNDKFTFLIIDDLRTIRNLMRHLLNRKFDCRILEAGDGAEGLRLIKEYKPDLVFCDVSMPVLDGLSMMKQLRETVEIKDTPVIILTALEDREIIRKLASFSILDYMLKPLEIHSAQVRIKKIVTENQHLFKRNLSFTS